jgi:hypothetical protein
MQFASVSREPMKQPSRTCGAATLILRPRRMSAKAAHADFVRALHQAEAGLREARAETPDIASPLMKQRAMDRVRIAGEAHDAALLAVESSRAALPGDVT